MNDIAVNNFLKNTLNDDLNSVRKTIIKEFRGVDGDNLVDALCMVDDIRICILTENRWNLLENYNWFRYYIFMLIEEKLKTNMKNLHVLKLLRCE